MEEPDFITVVGGGGRMGGLWTEVLTRSGYRVEVMDPRSGPMVRERLADCEVIFVAVPIPLMDRVMAELGPYTPPQGVVIDLCSVKEGPVRSMLAHCQGEVIGAHPLFGPAVGSLQGQTFFICPARGQRWLGWLRRFVQGQGLKPVEMEPRAHDHLMAVVQVLRHMLIFTFGLSLRDLGFDPASQARLLGPWFSQLLAQAENQATQGAELFTDLAFFNPAAEEVCRVYRTAAQTLGQAYGSRDRSALLGTLESVSDYLRGLDGGGVGSSAGELPAVSGLSA
jgi:prephenate dehydrogenase